MILMIVSFAATVPGETIFARLYQQLMQLLHSFDILARLCVDPD